MNLKEQIFWAGSEDLAKFLEMEVPAYGCPLCERFFELEHLKGHPHNNFLSVEHVPPENAGGNKLVLLCKECNSKTGSTIDSQLIAKKRAHELFEPGPNKFIEFRSGSVSINAFLDVKDPKNIGLRVDERHNAPDSNESFKKFVEELRENSDGMEFTIATTKRTNYHKRKAELGFLKFSFLYAFAMFGYGFAWNNNLALVRKQILNPEDHLIENFYLGLDDKRQCILMTDKPESAIIVCYGNRGALFPWGPTRDTAEFYSKLYANLQDKLVTFSFNKVLPLPTKMECCLSPVIHRKARLNADLTVTEPS